MKLHRRLLDNSHWRDHDWLAVWIWLLLNVAHHAHDALFDGKIVHLQPGQIVTGRLRIAAATNTCQAKVWRILETMKNEHQIEQQPGRKCSIITVSNWPYYQGTEQQSEQRLSNNRAATEQQLSTPGECTEGTEGKEVPPYPPLGDSANYYESRSVQRVPPPTWEEFRDHGLKIQPKADVDKLKDRFLTLQSRGWERVTHWPSEVERALLWQRQDQKEHGQAPSQEQRQAQHEKTIQDRKRAEETEKRLEQPEVRQQLAAALAGLRKDLGMLETKR